MTRNASLLLMAVVLGVALLAGVAIVSRPATVGIAADTPTLRNTITVSGEGKIYTASDQASISLGVHTVRSTASRAMGDNATAITKVVAALRSAGLNEDEIKTGNISLYPQQDWQEGHAPKILSYTADNRVIVKTKKLDKLGAIIDAATTAGATDISELRFELSEDSNAKQDAIKLAVQNARKKADALAQELGVAVGGPIITSESTQDSSPVVPYALMNSAAGAAKEMAPATPVMPQDVQVIVNVSVSFEMK